MKKQINIILFFLFATNLNIFAQANKLVTTTQKVMAEKTISEFCHYLEEIAQGKSAGLAILRNSYIEHFANKTWDDIETNELITFDKYLKKLQSKKPNIRFTKIPTRSDFLYYVIERKEGNNIIKVPFIAAPVEKTINGKPIKGYIFVRATTFQITNYKDHLPDWALITDSSGKVIFKDFSVSVNLLSQPNKLVDILQKRIAEKIISEYCHYVEELAQGKIASMAILKIYIDQFSNETWDDIETNKLISFRRYFMNVVNKQPKIHFTKIPTRSNFLYYTTERKEGNNIIKVPVIAAPIEKTINGKQIKGYIFVRPTTYKIINYKEHLPEWAVIVNENGKKTDNTTGKPIKQ